MSKLDKSTSMPALVVKCTAECQVVKKYKRTNKTWCAVCKPSSHRKNITNAARHKCECKVLIPLRARCTESAFHMVEIPSTIVRPNTLQVDYRSHAFELFNM